MRGALIAVLMLAACSSSAAPKPAPSPSGPFRLPAGVQALKLDGTPIGIAVAGATAWVALAGFNRVVPVSLAGQLSLGAPHPAGKTPLRVAIASDGVWATSFGNGRLVRISPSPLVLKAGDEPEGIVTTSDDALWVVDQSNGRVLRFAPDNRRLAGTADVGVEPRLLGANGTGVVVSSFGDGTITAVDAGLHARISKPLCTGAQGVAVHGATVAVACTGSNEVVMVDLATLRPTGRIALQEPDALAYTVDGTLLVGEQRGPSVAVVRAGKLACRVTVGVQPDVSDANVGLAALPDGAAVLTSPDVDGFYRVPASLLC